MDQKIQKHKKILAGIFLFIVMFSFFGSICKAAINEEYGNNDEVLVVDLEKKMEGSVLWDAIAQLIYGVGSLIEHLISGAMGSLTGSNVFPWADRIIFNTIPMLDINFFNPAPGSMFRSSVDAWNPNGTDLILAKIVRNVYYTILSLAVGFLGVAVGIMAIRLAISSIAAEKAKYKEAIMNWLLGIVMLFTMHFILSFVFYTNEQMVKVASKILTDILDSDEVRDAFNPITNFDSYKKVANNFIQKQVDGNANISQTDTWTQIQAYITKGAVDLVARPTSAGAVIKNLKNSSGTQSAQAYKDAIQKAIDDDDRVAEIVGRLMSSESYVKSSPIFNSSFGSNTEEEKQKIVNDYVMGDKSIGVQALQLLAMEIETYGPSDPVDVTDRYAMYRHTDGDVAEGTYAVPEYYFYKDGDKWYTDYIGQVNRYYAFGPSNDSRLRLLSPVVRAYKHGEAGKKDAGAANNQNGEPIQIISDMGTYFRESAWTFSTDSSGKVSSWRPDKVTLGGATLYAIFIIQSLMYFIQYIKRFFYIIILSLMGPIIVIYDFVTKSIR